MTITLGADPEIFFAAGDKPVSAIGMIGGTKANPRPLGDDFFIQEDNVAAEFNIPPANTFHIFDSNLQKGVDHVAGFANANNLNLSHKASAHFDRSELRSRQAKEFGCEPDYSAWTLKPNPRPTAAKSTFRTCGGHVHVGGVTHLDTANFVRAMDLFLGVPSVILDEDKDRRELYGKAGAFRPKSYGAEYRTLSNFWIFTSELRFWVWEATQKAIAFATSNRVEINTEIGRLIQDTINSSSEEGYLELAGIYPAIAVH